MIKSQIDRYREAAIAHGEGTVAGLVESTNRAYDTLQLLLSEISNSGFDEALFELYEDDSVSVQLWAAAHTLEIDPKRAKEKLKQIRDSEIPLISHSARYTLIGWDSGKLHFRREPE